MNVRNGGVKRGAREFERKNGVTEQPSPKKRRVEVGDRSVSLVKKSACDVKIQSFSMLGQCAKLDLTFCEFNINKAKKFVKVCVPLETSQALADIKFMKRLEDQFIKLISLVDNFKHKRIEVMPAAWFESIEEKISNVCYDLILMINNECKTINAALNAVEALNDRKYGIKESFDKLFIRNAQDPLKEEYCKRARANLTIFKNFQKMYYSYVLRDVTKCLKLAKIALFWKEEELALYFYKSAVSLQSEEQENLGDIVKSILRVLREYWIKNPFKRGSCKELSDFHINLKKDNDKRSGLPRSFSVYNGFHF